MKKVIFSMMAATFLFFFSHAQAAYPDREITLITSHAAGTSTDQAIRILSEAASKVLGQTIVIMNKPGASYVIGNSQVINSKPEGYTLGFCYAGAFAHVPHMRKVPYDFKKDVTWIGTCGDYTHGLVVKPDAPWKTLREFLDDAQKNPDTIIYSHDGYGLFLHVLMEYIAIKEGGIKWKFVPIPGGPKQATALLGGHTHAWAAGGFHVPFVRDKTMRLLVSFDRTRLKIEPEIPTIYEMGYETGIQGPSYVLFGPKGIPEPILRKIEDAYRKAVNDPSFAKLMGAFAVTPYFRNSKETEKYMSEESEAMGKLVKITGVKTEIGEK